MPQFITQIKWLQIAKEIAMMVIFIGFINFVLPRSVVQGMSMEPNIHTSDRLAASPIPYWFDEPQYGDIVMLHPVEENGPALVKRIIGVAGDVVEFRDKQLYINDELIEEPYITEACNWKCRDQVWEVGAGQIFVMGDNRNTSYDSRDYGAVDADKIMGKVLLRWWPLTDLALFTME